MSIYVILTSYCSNKRTELLLKNSQVMSRPRGFNATETITKTESCARTSFCNKKWKVKIK